MGPLTRTRPVRSELRRQVEGELQALFDRSAASVRSFGPDFSHLWTLTQRHVLGGKLIRPTLLLETYAALTETEPASQCDPQRAKPSTLLGSPGSGSVAGPCAEEGSPHTQVASEAVRIAAAVEALHCAFLLHDDVLDGDLVRRGSPNLIGELFSADADLLAKTPYKPAGPSTTLHWAQAGGVLAGNLLLAAAHQSFARADVPAKTRDRLLDLLDATIVETTAGEYTDIGLSDGVLSPDLQTVLNMTQRKTASYSFELPLRTAVILAGGSTELENVLGAAGAHMGLAYQLQDDLLSTFGDPNLHGKDPYSDLREGKQTALICFARHNGAWPELASHFGDPHLTVAQGEQLREVLRRSGAQDFVLELIKEHMDRATKVLSTNSTKDVTAPVRAVLSALVERIDGREA